MHVYPSMARPVTLFLGVHSMTRALRCAALCAAVSLAAHRVQAQVVDTTTKAAAPDSTMLSAGIIDAGRKIFHGKGTCFGCHGDKLQGGPVAPALTGPT